MSPVSATALRECEEAVIKAQAKARTVLDGPETGERFEAKALRKLSDTSDADLRARYTVPDDLADRLVNGAASDGYDFDVEGEPV